MNNPKLNYFPEQDVIHLTLTNDEEMDSIELSPNITAELNANSEMCGIEILKASSFLRDFILESAQAKLMQLQQAARGV
jgi:uncharacterized protein YuzE